MGIEHSQNYLHSKQLVATLLSKSNICNDDIVIEIGPGKGIITNELAKFYGWSVKVLVPITHLVQEKQSNQL